MIHGVRKHSHPRPHISHVLGGLQLRAVNVMGALDPRFWLKLLKEKGGVGHLLAFIVPLTVRLVPEILAWPYPLGFDTLIYADWMLQGTYLTLTVAELFKSTSLLGLVATVMGNVLGDVLLTVKVLGPVLLGLLAWLMYLYSRRVVGWRGWKALLVAMLVGTYFVSLRISWEMYRQMLGFIFLMGGLVALRVSDVRWRMVVTAVAGFLAVWSHELAAVLFFVTVAAYVVVKRGRAWQMKIAVVLMAAPGLLLFLYQRYSPDVGSIVVPYQSVASASPLALASFISGFLGYLFLPLLPLAVVGAVSFRGVDMWSWLALCLGFSYWPVFLPAYSVMYWFRWAILLVYPVVFLAVEGFGMLWGWGRRLAWKLTVGRVVAVSLLLVNLVMSGYYVTSLPEHQIQYFGEWNGYKQYMQTSMLQNSVSLSDTPAVVEALQWLNENAAGPNAVLLLHEALDNWARILVQDIELVRVDEMGLASQVRENVGTSLVQLADEMANNGKQVYTVWWGDGGGWYNMATLPSGFVEIHRVQGISVFQYVCN